MGEKKLSKMRKRDEKEERGARAALAAHQVWLPRVLVHSHIRIYTYILQTACIHTYIFTYTLLYHSYVAA